MTEERVVNGLVAVPFASVFGYNFMSLNQFLETATLTLGLITGLIALAFQVRRYLRGRKRDKLAAKAKKSCDE